MALEYLRESFGVEMKRVEEPTTFPVIVLHPYADPERTGKLVGVKGQLLEAFPNPGNSEITIPFVLERTRQARVRIFNASGQIVRTIEPGEMAAGRRAVKWDGRDDAAEEVASGIYLYRLEVDGRPTPTKKLSMVR